MSFTVKNVLDDTRPLVNDIEAETWSDQIFFQYINECVRLIYAEHPECRVETAGTLKAYTAITAVGNTIGLDDVYRQAVVEYLAYRFHDADAGDTRDKSRAAEHLQRFNTLLGAS
jgi:hypothetical protein